jgi:hypothetical protein
LAAPAGAGLTAEDEEEATLCVCDECVCV